MYKDEAGTWRCSSCDYCSKSSTSVSEHIESKHIQGPGFACDICQHVCPTRKALKMHIFRGKHYWWEEQIEIHNINYLILSLQTWIRWSRPACRSWKEVNGSVFLVDLHLCGETTSNTILRQNMSVVVASNAPIVPLSVQHEKRFPCISWGGIRLPSTNKDVQIYFQ